MMKNRGQKGVYGPPIYTYPLLKGRYRGVGALASALKLMELPLIVQLFYMVPVKTL